MPLDVQDMTATPRARQLLSPAGMRWAWQGLFIPGHPSYQFLFFCLAGLSGVVVNYLVMWGLYQGLGLYYILSSVGAHLVASLNNYTWNKLVTFRDRRRGLGAVLRQYLTFLSVTLVGLAINQAVLVGLVELAGLDPVPANLAGVLLATVSNFLGAKFITFRIKGA